MKRCLCLDLDLWVRDGCAGDHATDAVEAMIPYWSEVREGIAHCLDLDVHGCTADDHRALRPSKGFELLLHVGVRETHRWSGLATNTADVDVVIITVELRTCASP